MKNNDMRKMIEDLCLKNKRLTVRVSDDLYKDLKKLAKAYNMTVSNLIRYLVISGVHGAEERGLL